MRKYAFMVSSWQTKNSHGFLKKMYNQHLGPVRTFCRGGNAIVRAYLTTFLICRMVLKNWPAFWYSFWSLNVTAGMNKLNRLDSYGVAIWHFFFPHKIRGKTDFTQFPALFGLELKLMPLFLCLFFVFKIGHGLFCYGRNNLIPSATFYFSGVLIFKKEGEIGYRHSFLHIKHIIFRL